jgi:MATE family multidrug resistance protein
MTDIAEFDLPHAGRRVTGHGLDAWLAEARELARLAVPLVFTQLAQMAIMTTDVIMLGHFSTSALASAALGNTVFFFCWLIGCGPVAAVSPMIAHTLGARPKDRLGVRTAVRMGFWSLLITSLPLIVMLLFVEQILRAFGQTPELAQGAGIFTRALCLGLPFSLGYQVLRNYSTALSRPNASLVVMVAGIGYNALADYALIFGHFGLPRLGILGSGIASASSYTFCFIAMVVVVWLTPTLRQYRIWKRLFHPHWERLSEIFRLGMPIGLTMMFEAMLFNASMLVMGTFGTRYVDAHQVALNVPSITFMVPLGIGISCASPPSCSGSGRGRSPVSISPIRRRIWTSSRWRSYSCMWQRRFRSSMGCRWSAHCRCVASRTRARRCGSLEPPIGSPARPSASGWPSVCT